VVPVEFKQSIRAFFMSDVPFGSYGVLEVMKCAVQITVPDPGYELHSTITEVPEDDLRIVLKKIGHSQERNETLHLYLVWRMS
jgi:hypothetical protein